MNDTAGAPSFPAAPLACDRQTPSWVEVDLAAVRRNLHSVRDFLARAGEGQSVLEPAPASASPRGGLPAGPASPLLEASPPRVLAVVKANAYGHGAIPVARVLAEEGVAGLAVASVVEGAQLREAGLSLPMLVLAAGDASIAGESVRLGLIQTVCSKEMLGALAEASQRLGRPARVHLKIDSGLGRLGIRPDEVAHFAAHLRQRRGLWVEGAFTHLATADDADPAYAQLQHAEFSRALQGLAGAGFHSLFRHMANSAATLRFPRMHLDAVRPGLLVYGIRPDAPGLPALDLQPALTWKTRVAFVRLLPGGHSVSYSRTYVADRERRCAVLPVGYADGYPRRSSNRAQVLARGAMCPVIGTVCMDHVMIDLTPAGDVAAGEEVVLLGAQGQARITANDIAAWAETVVHEVPTVIGNRVARCYTGGDRAGSGSARGEDPDETRPFSRRHPARPH